MPNPIQFSSADVAMPKGLVLHPMVGEQSRTPTQGKGTFVPLLQGCIAVASVALESWIGLDSVSGRQKEKKTF